VPHNANNVSKSVNQRPKLTTAQPSSSNKTRLNDLSYGIKFWTDLSSALSQCTRWQTGRQTYGRTDSFLL